MEIVHITASEPKEILKKKFVGKHLEELRTPAFVVDEAIFASNCARMHESVKKWNATFRAHVKTHKTAEGTRHQLVSSSGNSSAIIVSTLQEAWQILKSGLVDERIVVDILYGLPIGPSKIPEVAELADQLLEKKCHLRVLVDHVDQIDAIEKHYEKNGRILRWSAFIKVDAGNKRAGLRPSTNEFNHLLARIVNSTTIDIYGFYCHSGNAYASASQEIASGFLSDELTAVNEAAQKALSLLKAEARPSWVLSVGSTPTAHAASVAEVREKLQATLLGDLEIHAGNYPMLDLQQLATSLIEPTRISQKIISSVISYYPGRGEDETDEAICDAGAIALSKDTGPLGGYGEVISNNGKGWRLGRVSQEHGILVASPKAEKRPESIKIGSKVEIVGQHACLIAAAHPWYYVVDSREDGGRVVKDIWVPWKGW